MEYAKLDAGLAGALSDVRDPEDQFVVFVRTKGPLGREEASLLESWGVRVQPNSLIHTGTLSARRITELSEEPWVTRLSLSQTLRPKG